MEWVAIRCKSRRRLQLTWMVKQHGAASPSSLFAGATPIMFLTELLNQSLKVAINSSDLPLDEMGTLLQVASYVAHGPLPPLRSTNAEWEILFLVRRFCLMTLRTSHIV
jgi:hypothetical protein